MAELTVAKTSDLQPGQGMVVQAQGRAIALFNVDGSFYAIDNTCQHRGGPLGEGELEGCIVTCPWHGWQYDVRNGESQFDRKVKVACFPTVVVGDEVKVSL